MSSYKGADSFSIENIVLNIGSSVKNCYQIMFDYFNGQICLWNMLPTKLVWAAVVIIACSFVIVCYGLTRGVCKTTICVVVLCLAPMAANVTTILLPNNVPSTQQTAPLALVIPGIVAMILGLDGYDDRNDKVRKIVFSIVVAVSILILHGSIFQSLADQNTIREGTMAAKALSQSVVDKLIADGDDIGKNTYAFVGYPKNNGVVSSPSPVYFASNRYVRFDGLDSELDSWTWRGILANIDGVKLNMCDDDTYNAILRDEKVKQMPNFPAEGYIMTHSSGVRVIKVSD